MAVVLFVLTGCYEKFDTPAAWTRIEKDSEIPEGYTLVPISTVTALFTDPSHTLQDVIGNTAKGQSPSIPITGGRNESYKTDSFGKYYLISEKYVIKGKVISNDAYGNFYRSLFILDDYDPSDPTRQGIEVKIGTGGLNTKYPVGETVYVVCDGLALGNYRTMLSLGLPPTAEDISDSGEAYANKYMDIQSVIDRHVKLGPKTALTDNDIIVVDATEPIDNARFDNLVGRLVKVEGMKSVWDDEYPQFLYKYGFNTYANYSFAEAFKAWEAYNAKGRPAGEEPMKDGQKLPEPLNLYVGYGSTPLKIHTTYQPNPQPSWGFQEYKGEEHSNYGSALFTMSGYTGGHEIIVRTSGYARFALEPVPANGATVSITGIIQRYTGKQGTWPAYQFAVNNSTDVKTM
jgi:hypothetical protein